RMAARLRVPRSRLRLVRRSPWGPAAPEVRSSTMARAMAGLAVRCRLPAGAMMVPFCGGRPRVYMLWCSGFKWMERIMPTSDADLRRLIELCERVLSTPGGVTELDWDSLAPGGGPAVALGVL